MASELPRVRQAVLAATDLGGVVRRLREHLPQLREPFADPGVGLFGLRNAVFALGDTFLEVVSPVRDDTAAGRLLDRRGGDCGYMVMFQVEDLRAARERVRAAGVREVFDVALEDISEVHLHPGDMRGAIVSLSAPTPADSWRWGGPDWRERAAGLSLAGLTVAVADPDEVRQRWDVIVGGPPDVVFVADPAERGPVEIRLGGAEAFEPLQIGSVRLVSTQLEEVHR